MLIKLSNVTAVIVFDVKELKPNSLSQSAKSLSRGDVGKQKAKQINKSVKSMTLRTSKVLSVKNIIQDVKRLSLRTLKGLRGERGGACVSSSLCVRALLSQLKDIKLLRVGMLKGLSPALVTLVMLQSADSLHAKPLYACLCSGTLPVAPIIHLPTLFLTHPHSHNLTADTYMHPRLTQAHFSRMKRSCPSEQ